MLSLQSRDERFWIVGNLWFLGSCCTAAICWHGFCYSRWRLLLRGSTSGSRCSLQQFGFPAIVLFVFCTVSPPVACMSTSRSRAPAPAPCPFCLRLVCPPFQCAFWGGIRAPITVRCLYSGVQIVHPRHCNYCGLVGWSWQAQRVPGGSWVRRVWNAPGSFIVWDLCLHCCLAPDRSKFSTPVQLVQSDPS